MILNVRGCSNKTGIIVSYLVENKEKTGYDSFNAKKIIVKNKIDMLAAIKKTLISSRKLSEISASDFVSTINAIGKKNVSDTSLKTIVKSINDENMQPIMLTLSHVCFNNKPLPQIKAINIINGNMYFMIKVGSNYTLELIKNEKIKCVIVISSLVNLYRRVKQWGARPKDPFVKKNYKNAYHTFREENTSNDGIAEPLLEERPINLPNDWCSRPLLYTYPEGTVTGVSSRPVEEDLANANVNIPTPERQQAGQINQIERTIEPLYEETPQSEITDTTEEERPSTVRQATVNSDSFTVVEIPQPVMSDEIEEERPIRTDLRRTEDMHTEIRVEESQAIISNRIRERVAERRVAERRAEEERQEEAERERREVEVAVSIAERMAENESLDTEEERTNTLDIEISQALERRLERTSDTARIETETETTPNVYRRNRGSFVEYLRENQNNTFNSY